MLLAEFGAWLGRERGLSPATARCYAKQAKHFAAAVGRPTRRQTGRELEDDLAALTSATPAASIANLPGWLQ